MNDGLDDLPLPGQVVIEKRASRTLAGSRLARDFSGKRGFMDPILQARVLRAGSSMLLVWPPTSGLPTIRPEWPQSTVSGLDGKCRSFCLQSGDAMRYTRTILGPVRLLSPALYLEVTFRELCQSIDP